MKRRLKGNERLHDAKVVVTVLPDYVANVPEWADFIPSESVCWEICPS